MVQLIANLFDDLQLASSTLFPIIMDVFAELSSSNRSCNSLLSGSTFNLSSSSTNEEREKSTSAAQAPSVENSAEPKRKGRKGHKKSRTGCFNCKSTKIKVSSVPLKVCGERG
jgi:hypothetical protein